MQFILFFKIGKTASAARNWIKSSPKTEATTFAFYSVFILLLSWELSWKSKFLRKLSVECRLRISNSEGRPRNGLGTDNRVKTRPIIIIFMASWPTFANIPLICRKKNLKEFSLNMGEMKKIQFNSIQKIFILSKYIIILWTSHILQYKIIKTKW